MVETQKMTDLVRDDRLHVKPSRLTTCRPWLGRIEKNVGFTDIHLTVDGAEKRERRRQCAGPEGTRLVGKGDEVHAVQADCTHGRRSFVVQTNVCRWNILPGLKCGTNGIEFAAVGNLRRAKLTDPEADGHEKPLGLLAVGRPNSNVGSQTICRSEKHKDENYKSLHC